MSKMLGEVMADGGGLGALEPEDELDAFNDETFGGDGLGEQWEENAHEQLAMMTEEERQAHQQSDAFFNFGSDGEELGGDLEDPLEPPPRTNGSAPLLTQKMESLAMTPHSALPPHHHAAHGPLTVQTAGPPLTPGGPAYPGHYAPQHLLPPSAFASAGPALQVLSLR